jgi:hypothetical protein
LREIQRDGPDQYPIYCWPGLHKANASLLAPFIWGGLGYTQGLLNNPTYIAKDENNILYVSDTENGRVQGFYLTPNECRTDATFYREWGNDLNLQYGAGRLKADCIAYDNRVRVPRPDKIGGCPQHQNDGMVSSLGSLPFRVIGGPVQAARRHCVNAMTTPSVRQVRRRSWSIITG